MNSPLVASVPDAPHVGAEAPVRVLLIDPDDVARAGLHAVLASDGRFIVVGEAASDGAALAQQRQPDLIVFDPATADGVDETVVTNLATAAPASHLCIYTSVARHQDIIQVVLAGVDGYLLKRRRKTEDLCHVLFTISQYGDLVIDRAILLDARACLKGKVSVALPEQGDSPLSPDEQSVLERLSEGLKREAIADAEGMSLRKVGRILRHLFDQLEVSSSVELVVEARRRGYLL